VRTGRVESKSLLMFNLIKITTVKLDSTGEMTREVRRVIKKEEFLLSFYLSWAKTQLFKILKTTIYACCIYIYRK
jgi:hypothetical protein